ncbi:MAG: hypothetical protein MUO40_01285, partial [Anaerolineaceae bacterium]|nr:hypothetical protein [Anaerolineaceae bacterium]
LPIPEQQEGEIIELSWFDSDNILISIFNSLEFSYTQLGYFNLLDQQYREMTTSHFQKLIQLNEEVVLLSQDIQKKISQLDIYSLGNFSQTLVLDENCTQVHLSPLPCFNLIVTCKQNSYSLDNNFSITLLPEIQGELFFSPDNKFIIIDQTNSSDDQQSLLTLMNADFSSIREYHASSTRQVVWQPDSQGFLYLTLEGLYYVSLPNGEPTRVYEFNTDDYRYLDFIWIVP